MYEEKTKKAGFLSQVVEILTTAFFHLLKIKGVNTGNYSSSAKIFSVILISLFTSGGWIWSLFQYFGNAGEQVKPNQAAQIESLLNTQNQTPRNQISEDAKDCGLSKAKWEPFLGNVNVDGSDNSYIILPLNQRQGSFKYKYNIEDVSVCEFQFIPRGDNVINYVITFIDIFEVVIGDNDYKVVSLKAGKVIDGQMNFIAENRTGNTRPKLSAISIKKGSLVKVTIKQKFLNKNTYEVTVLVSTQETKDGEEESFAWAFNPSPRI